MSSITILDINDRKVDLDLTLRKNSPVSEYSYNKITCSAVSKMLSTSQTSYADEPEQEQKIIGYRKQHRRVT